LNTLADVITYVRRIIKSPSNSTITDNLIIDYINRFWIMDVDARIQLFDLKTVYNFQTTPGVDKYNMPLYTVQTETVVGGIQSIASFPVYQGFLTPCFVNGIEVPFYTQRESYYNLWPNYTQQLNPAAIGNGTNGPYTLNLPYFPALPGHVDMSGIIATGTIQDPPLVPSGPSTNFITTIPSTSVYSCVYFTATLANGQNIVISDSGQFLEDNVDGNLYGLLMLPGAAPDENQPLYNGYSTTSNTVNYNTGTATFTLPVGTVIPDGVPINAQCYFYQQGIPRSILFYDNTITLRPCPNTQYNVELGCYLSPAAFLQTTAAIPFGYMAEYLARGAARKILSDTGDIEQFQFYEPLFKEQEMLVWKRSQRQFTSTRTQTIYSYGPYQGQVGPNALGSTTL